jgi:HK97 gp10 family phage protein
MQSNTITISGLAETQRAIHAYSAKLSAQISRLALRQGANFMLKQIRAAAPVKTGRLKRAIKIKNSKINRIKKNGKIGVYIAIDPGKKRNDPKGCFYGKFVEGGYRRRGGTVEGKHFIRRTYHANKERALQLTVAAAEMAANRIASGLGLNVK